MNQLQLFYQNEAMREAVQQFIVSSLRELAFDELLKNEDARYLAKSIQGVEKAFETLDVEFGRITKASINEAR